jgi:hypothetical protein
MPRKHPREIPHAEIVRHCEKWPTNIMWPAPIDMRLSSLVDLAVEAGEPDALSRSELLAALVLAAPADGEKLESLLRAYRKAKVGQAAIRKNDESPGTNVITLEGRRPGRR